MKNGFLKTCACLFVLCSPFFGNVFLSADHTLPYNGEEFCSVSISVTPDDLEVHRDEIFVKVDGNFYPLRALERRGDRWVAIVAAEYCPNGHMTCRGCGQCHTKKCRYFVRFCKLWEDK